MPSVKTLASSACGELRLESSITRQYRRNRQDKASQTAGKTRGGEADPPDATSGARARICRDPGDASQRGVCVSSPLSNLVVVSDRAERRVARSVVAGYHEAELAAL